MTKDEIKIVEDYIASNTPEGVKIVSMITTKAPVKRDGPSFYTICEIEEEASGLKARQSFNSLKILREIKKRAKYGKD